MLTRLRVARIISHVLGVLLGLYRALLCWRGFKIRGFRVGFLMRRLWLAAVSLLEMRAESMIAI
ncbi:hypothetical protein [Corynebacterium guaraldiae]|uniref:hypothetical protein n=1 Tax=Corynebacterium guaraldiae TaxID=3051103 RepID=UPI002095E233|nr:hypothetical protein [Corynebacterium guaraldiae]